MSFIAIRKSDGTRIDITQIDQPRKMLPKDDIVCQLCGKPMIIKAGIIVRAHFAHLADAECDTDYRTNPETPEHRQAKIELVRLLKETLEEYSTADLSLEVPIPEVKRVADILVTFPMGWRIAHEIQLSNIGIHEFEERTHDYNKAGIDVVWWLGRGADNESNESWCMQNFGVCYHLNLDGLRERTDIIPPAKYS
jgi:competence protein CoiA